MTDFKEYIEKFASLLPLSASISYTEAERRASEFLGAQATLTNWKHMLSGEKIKLVSVQTAVFTQEMSKGTSKTMTENKMYAESSDAYTNAREALEQIENDISYLKSYYDIFGAAHVFYRQMARGESL